jgi:gliding motility-associated-like protein
MPDSVCVGATKRYYVNDATVPSTYVWKINGITQTATTYEIFITWNTAGVFTLTVQEENANGCKGLPEQGVVNVFALPIADAGPDQTICFNNTATLNGTGGLIYHWSPTQYLTNNLIANPTVTLPGAGVYSYALTVENLSGCKSILADTVKITMLAPLQIFAGNDTTIGLNLPLQLEARDNGISGFVSYLWSPSFGLNNSSIKNPILNINATGVYLYIVVGTNAIGCTATDDIIVKIFKGPEIYVPTVFTPNEDGVNDVFIPIYIGIKELKYFRIYDRWGKLMLTTTNQNMGWNGMYKGVLQNNAAYVWQVEGISITGEKIFKKGTVVLAK